MIARWIALVVIWLALQGEVTAGNVVAALLVVTVITVLFPNTSDQRHAIHPLGTIALVAFVLKSLVTSSWNVLVTVLRPTAERTHTDVIAVALTSSSRLVATLVANAITLTPGTMTVDISGGPGTGMPDTDALVLQVHVLGRVDADEFRDEILDLERRVLAAITLRSSPSAPERVPNGTVT